MTTCRIAIYGDGRHELGRNLGRELSPDSLPALPELVHRLLRSPSHLTYTPKSFPAVPPVHGRGRKYARKAQRAIREAGRLQFAAAAILIDRDRQPDAKRIVPLREGRDALMYGGFPACAVGMAVEAFDAWMIADAKAAEAAGGDPAKSHPSPESLDGREGSGKHPKDVAAEVFGSAKGLGGKYAVVAANVDLSRLEEACPKGFKPFADEVRGRIGPVVARS